MELLTENVNSFPSLSNFAESSILDVRLLSKYVSACLWEGDHTNVKLANEGEEDGKTYIHNFPNCMYL